MTSSVVYGSTSFFVGDDITTDERQAIPLAAEEVAVHLVSQISEGWWLVKGEAQLWEILNDKLEMLRAGKRSPKRSASVKLRSRSPAAIFPENDPSLGMSYEKLGAGLR